MNMQVLTAILLITIISFTNAAPKNTKLNFRHVFKTPGASLHPKPNPRIIGGQEATPHSIPYQAFLEISAEFSGWYCGGSLISPTDILTTASCCDDAEEIEITLGAHRVLDVENTQQTVMAYSIKMHENYDSRTNLNDICLLRLKNPVTLNSAVQVVKLPSKSDAGNSYAGKSSTASGWGATDGSSMEQSEVLNKIDVEVITNGQCESLLNNGQIPTSQICTSGDQSKGSCAGDIGGPLTVNGVQVGISSYTALNCMKGYPTAYTRVTSYLDWITAN